MIVVFVYGLLLLVGGIMGHLKAQSMVSLISGVVSGVAMLATGFMIWKKNKWGYGLALILTLILDTFFTYRYLVTGSFVPAGMMSLISLAVLCVLYLTLRKR